MEDYLAYIVDMDGTLYYKRPMQIKMALRLLGYYFLHISRLPELFMLYEYRKLRDQEDLAEDQAFETTILQKLAQKYHCSQERARQVIDDWILTRPIGILYSCRDQRLIPFLEAQLHKGKQVFVYSDYPAVQKCNALAFHPSGVYWPDGKEISVLKPSAQGLNHIIQANRLDKTQLLFIGDRQEKDGACALSAGIDHIILKKSRIFRALQYRKLLKRE